MANNGTGAGSSSQDVDTQDTENLEDQDVDTQDTDNAEDDADGDGLPKTQEELDALMKKRLARQKAQMEKKHKADLKKLQDQKDKSDLEVEQQKAKDLQAKISDKNFLLAAKDAGASKTGAEKLLKLYRADFELDDDGEITNIEDLLETAKTDFEELFGTSTGSGDGGSGNGGSKPKDPAKAWNDSIKKELGY